MLYLCILHKNELFYAKICRDTVLRVRKKRAQALCPYVSYPYFISPKNALFFQYPAAK